MEPARSLWFDTADQPAPSVSPLAADAVTKLDADVVIVGAGYSGLWTAHYLLDHDPTLRVVIIERDVVGFGASGRNGGWCIGELAAGFDKLAAAGGATSALALMRAMFDAVDEVGRVVAAAGFECDFRKGGALRLARNSAQLTRQHDEVAHLHSIGFSDDDMRLLDATEATAMMAAPGVRGGLFFAHAAALHPAKLVHGLAASVRARGAAIFEHTAALSIEPGRVVTSGGDVRGRVVVQATEGYTRDLAGQRRSLLPLYSLMIATEPLPAETWSDIGLADRPTFTDDRRLVIYGQRTADDRIAFGGRGAPYRFGSRIDASIEARSRTHDLIAASLRELLPQTASAEITHRWGGVLGVPRDWFPSLGFDRATGLARLGGYVGEGVAAANLAGRTLADLVVGADTERTTYPWIDRRLRRWEPEPLRWLGINAALRGVAVADRAEQRTDRPSRVGALADRLLG
ncbi:MAG TPA: FAD-binding oxidoreductase [Ilumatobacter sp.]|nr:FAD-binding oxidoreductase [Ilumatobacter sp.]